MPEDSVTTNKIRTVKTALTALLSLLLCVSLFVPVFSIRAESLDELKAEKEQIAAELEEARNDLAYLEGQTEALNARLAALQADRQVQQGEYERLLEELDRAKRNLEAAILNHQQAVEALAQKQQEFEDRITALFRVRHKSTLEVLLSSDSMQGFFTNMRLMTYIGQVDNSLIDQLNAAREVAYQAKLNREATKQEYDLFVAEKEKQLEELAAGIELTQTDLEDVSNKILLRSDDMTNLENRDHETTAAIDSLLAEMAAEEARKKAAEIAANSGGGGSGPPPDAFGEERMWWPLPNYTSLSDAFGWRADPFSNTGSYMHWGVDFPAPVGTIIRASLSGTVRLVSAPLQGSAYGGSGFGNYCTIASEGGIALIYAHQTEVWVSEGQYVHQGEAIGTVGSTGYSTGPHLHFQMRVAGNSAFGIDPMPYLP